MKYCLECGKQNGPTANFCQGCGQPFVSLSAGSLPPVTAKTRTQPIKPVKSIKPTRRPINEEVDEDDDENGRDDEQVQIPNIDSLEVEITANEIKRSKIDDLASGSSRPYTPQQTKVSKKSVLQEFQKEASARRPRN